MRIMHISDTHGLIPTLMGNFDVIVHSGDFFPNKAHIKSSSALEEEKFQIEWLKRNGFKLKSACGDKKFLFTLGNHDFINPLQVQDILYAFGVDAEHLHEKVVCFDNVNFYGFPFIPSISGNWNYETKYGEMESKIDVLSRFMNSNTVDVFVSHAPPKGILDASMNRDHNFGCMNLLSLFRDKLKKEMLPEICCFGHIHESYGTCFQHGVLFSNAATTQNILEVNSVYNSNNSIL